MLLGHETGKCRRRARLLRIVIAVFASLALAGCGNKEPWPMKEGNEWVYLERIQQSATPTGEVRYVMSSVSTSGDTTRAVLQAFRGQATSKFMEIELTRTGKGIYESRRTAFYDMGGYTEEQETGVTPLGGEPPFLVMNKPKVGDTWKYSYRQDNKAFETSSVFNGRGLAEKMEGITPAAGRFKALRVSWNSQAQDNVDFENRIYWFKRGVGPVKIEIQRPSSASVFMLKKAKIGKKKIGKW